MSTNPKLIAFYLPQFHPIPENDEWWGKGFTEWTNVTKAEPLYEGHYQPHLPADLGFYDLRLRETRREQIQLAKRYGIEGFCYHYYWFSGKRLLEKPLNDMLADPDSDMPFCICWANENWTRRWDGAEHQLLMGQNYTNEDDIQFIKDLIPILKDPRYIKINNVPFVIVYRPQQLPDVHKTVATWRNYARKEGIEELHLCAALTHGNEDYLQLGFDSGIEFPPHNLNSVHSSNNEIDFKDKFSGYAINYDRIARSYLNRSTEDRLIFKTVFPSWDNTARCNNRALIVLNGTPTNYEYWLSESIKLTKRLNKNRESLVFINAWNEWAEGCHLEPDRKYGHQFLEATLRATSNLSTLTDFADIDIPKVPQRKFFRELNGITSYHFSTIVSQVRSWRPSNPKIKSVIRKTKNLARKVGLIKK